jgi:hypothetical protein
MVEALFYGINSDKPPFLTGAGFTTVGMDPLWIPLGFPFLSPSLAQEEMPIMPADHRSHLFPKRARHFVRGVDDYAQLLGLMKACKKNMK